MVSLGSNSSTGGRFFDATNMDDETTNMDEHLLAILAEHERKFKPLKTVLPFSFHLFISALISLTGIALATCWKDDKRCEAYFIMLYMRVAFWLITFIFDHFIKHHHEELRLNGYHDFYRATSMHKEIPFYMVSLWNATFMGIQTLMQHYYGPNFGLHCAEVMFSPIVYISLFSSVETILFMAVHGSYIKKVVHFNRLQPSPDAMTCGGTFSYDTGAGSVGLTQRGAAVAELLEKQADLISYLKEHKDMLSLKVMLLTTERDVLRRHIDTDRISD